MTPEEALSTIRGLLGEAGYASAWGSPSSVVDAMKRLLAGDVAWAKERIRRDATPGPGDPPHVFEQKRALEKINVHLAAAGYRTSPLVPSVAATLCGALVNERNRLAEDLDSAKKRIQADALASHLQSPDAAELKRKLHAAHRELDRRRRRDEELASHMPVIAARLQSMAADAALDLRGAKDERWDVDKAIDWTGIDGGHP